MNDWLARPAGAGGSAGLALGVAPLGSEQGPAAATRRDGASGATAAPVVAWAALTPHGRLGLAAPPRRIAVFRALYLGDLLCAVPALRALRAAFPAAEITLIGLPWAAAFARRFSRYLDRFVEFAGYPGLAEIPVDPERTAGFLAAQRAYGYDLVVQMHGSGRVSTPLALALGGRATLGYYETTPPAGLTLGTSYPADQTEVQRNLALVALLGGPADDAALEFPLFPADCREAAAVLQPLAAGRRPWIGLNPCARPPARRWPAEYFAAVGDHFARTWDARVVITGGPGEEPLAAAVAARMAAPALDVAGRTSLGGLAALIAALDLFVSNDTGPAHLARAVLTPSVTVFGPADPLRWAPPDSRHHRVVRQPVDCSPCAHWECPIDHRCLRRLSPARVISAGESLLRRESVACND
jgi:ADP-heptose:LPS heptosyltransferase